MEPVSQEHPEPSLPAQVLSLIGIVGFILLFLGIVFIAYLPLRPDTSADAVRSEERIQILETTRNDGIERITTYKAINPADGVYQIPIDRAKELVLKELRPEE